MHEVTANEKRVMNLKEWGEVYGRVWRKGKKCCKYIYIIKLQRFKKKESI